MFRCRDTVVLLEFFNSFGFTACFDSQRIFTQRGRTPTKDGVDLTLGLFRFGGLLNFAFNDWLRFNLGLGDFRCLISSH